MATNGEPPPPQMGFKLFGKTIVSMAEKDGIGDESAAAEEEEDAGGGGGAKARRAHLPCPRCKSRDTKFCYFNNYNVNQPRHFCKACHRYWTAGGALRNVPVGAGRRKNRALPQGSGGGGGSSSGSGGEGGMCVVGGEDVERWLRS